MGNILIGADLVPTKSNVDLFSAGDAKTLVGEELQKILAAANYRIFNLETPLADIKSPITKCGPHLIAPTATIKGYKAIGADILALANNHILDHGVDALNSTRRVLKENAIAFFGVGDNAQEAAEPYIFEFARKKIGLYACVEHEFSIVAEGRPGANPFDPLESLDHVGALKEKCDFVIVLYHGGKEHYRYPSPNLRKICRKLIEKGADLVVCQHSHCIGCEEMYRGGTIVYGQGNFLFDKSDNEFWQTALLITLDAELKVAYIPLMKDKNKVRLADEVIGKEILDNFKARSREIAIDGVVEAKYLQYAQTMMGYYLVAFSGIYGQRVWRRLHQTFPLARRIINWLLRRKYNARKRLLLRNFIECEAHHEMVLTGLSERR